MRLGFLKVCSLAFLLLGGGVVLGAAEVFVDGDMSTLDGWEQQRLPFDFQCEIVGQNSPFVEIFPANGGSLLMKEGVGRAHQEFLLRRFDPLEGKFLFGFDFKLDEDNPEFPLSGYVVQLLCGEEVLASFTLRENFHVNQHLGVREESRWQPPKNAKIQTSTWYRLECEIDLPNRLLSGRIVSENAEEMDFSGLTLPQAESGARDFVDGLRLRAASGPEASAGPILLDNFTLRTID